MASLPPASPGSDGAGGSASGSQDFGPTLEETRQELRLLSPKISKCEAALESGGSYIGISDPVILLEQLKVLQRKDTQLREVLLILLRASPLHAPRSPTSPLANASALLPAPPQRQAQAPQVKLQIPAPTTPASAAAPTTAPPPTAAIAPALTHPLSRTPARRSSTAAEIQARRERARAAAAATAPTPAPVAALPSTPLSTSTAPPPYERSAYRPPSPPPSIPSGRTLSLHEALGLVPLAEAPPAPAPAVETSAGQPQGRPEVNRSGSGDVQSQSSLPSPKPPPTYFPGRHALYRASVPSRRVGTAAAASSRGVSSRSSRKSSPDDFIRHEVVNGHAGRRESLEKAVASGSSIEGSRSSGEKTSAPAGIKASVAAAAMVNPSDGGVTLVAEGRTGRFAPSGAGVGHGVIAMPVDAAVGGSNDDQAKVRELAEVATAFDRKIGAESSSSPVPAPSSGKEVSAGSNATKLEDDGTRKETAIENRGPCAESDGAATAPAAVGAGAVNNSSRDSSSPSGIAAKAVVKTLKSTSPISAKSVRSSRNNKRKMAPRPGLRVSTRRTRASTNAMETAAGVVPVRSPVSPPPADVASTGTTVVKAVVKSSAEVSGGSAGTKSSQGKSGSEGSHTETEVGKFRRDNENQNGSMRKRRKSAETGGWRSRYNAEEFELGELNSSSISCSSFSGGSDTESDEGQPREAGGGKGSGGDGVEWDEILVDVGEDDGDDGDGVGDGGGVRRVKLIRKRDPPNAWKRRCADGTCLLGASFGYEGKHAVYCSAHKDAGMVNVTHRRCEEPGCLHQPSFNMEGERKALYCRAHKRDGMVNVSAPRCDTPGCMVRPSFGFLGDKRATLCDAHKKPGMLNVRRRKVLCSLQGSQALPLPASIEEDDREGKKETRSESRPEGATAPVPVHLAQDSALPVAPIPTSMPIMSCVSAPSVPGSGSDDGEGVDVGGAPVSIVGGAPREEGVTPMEVLSSAS